MLPSLGQTEVMGLGKEYQEGDVYFSMYHIRGLGYQHKSLLMMLTLMACLGWCLLGFSTVKLLFFPFHILFVRTSC